MTLIKRLDSRAELQRNGKLKQIQYSEFHCDYCNTQVTKVHGAGLRAPTCGDISCLRKLKVQRANEKYPTSPMTKVQDLGIIETKPQRFEHMAVYECPVCSQHITITFNDGKTQKTCGKLSCKAQTTLRKRTYKTTHGMSHTNLYHVWQAMTKRCKLENKDNPLYKHYAGKGITVCSKWLTFEGFYEDMGQGYESFRGGRPSIDRINPDGNYEPNNCQWITHEENSIKDGVIPVVQVELTGKIVATYASAAEASRLVNGTLPAKIRAVANGTRKTHAGFRWYNSGEYTEEVIEIDTPIKKVSVATRLIEQLDKHTLEVVSTFKTPTEACTAIGIPLANGYRITECCNGKRSTIGGYRWRYEGTAEKIEDETYSIVVKDCSAKWKDYSTYVQDVGVVPDGYKIVKENTNKPWSKSNYKVVKDSYSKNITTDRVVEQLTKEGELVATFSNSIAAAKATGVSNGNIRAVCLGNKKRKSAGGFKWRYYTQPSSTTPHTAINHKLS